MSRFPFLMLAYFNQARKNLCHFILNEAKNSRKIRTASPNSKVTGSYTKIVILKKVCRKNLSFRL